MTIEEKIKTLVQKDKLFSAFITQALLDYCDNIIENKELVKRDLAGSFIDAESWITMAEEMKKIL